MNDIFRKIGTFARRHGMQIVAAALILGLAAVAVGNMGDIMQGLRKNMTGDAPDDAPEILPEQTTLPQKIDPQPKPEAAEREPLPSDDEEPSSQEDAPMVEDAVPSAADQQVIAPEFVPVYIYPLQGEVQKEFSGNTLVRSETMEDWRTHNGIDIACSLGDTAVAIQSGEVTYMMQEDMWGYVVELRLDSGIRARYCGLDAPAEGLVVGSRLSQGEPVGTVGTAMMESAEPPHLHLETIRNGEYLSPRELIG